MDYGFSRTLDVSYEEALERVTTALKDEGFGVLTKIDVQDIFKKKLDVAFKKYAILGACNPPLAHQALMAEEQIGLLLPCNVIVYENEGKAVVAAFNPMMMMKLVDSEKMGPLAEEVTGKLQRVVKNV